MNDIQLTLMNDELKAIIFVKWFICYLLFCEDIVSNFFFWKLTRLLFSEASMETVPRQNPNMKRKEKGGFIYSSPLRMKWKKYGKTRETLRLSNPNAIRSFLFSFFFSLFNTTDDAMEFHRLSYFYYVRLSFVKRARQQNLQFFRN